MLTTQPSHEHRSVPYLAEPGAIFWRDVTLTVAMPYILVSYEISNGGGWLPRTSLFWRDDDVVSFCRDVIIDQSRKIVDILLLLPAY